MRINEKKKNGQTDGRTDRQTDRQTDGHQGFWPPIRFHEKFFFSLNY